MKMLFPEDYGDTPGNLMRKCGYSQSFDPNTQKLSYARYMGNGRYPRFHVYLHDHKDGFVVALHLDQKKSAAYGKMHGGEYEGTAVRDEIMRIASVITGRSA